MMLIDLIIQYEGEWVLCAHYIWMKIAMVQVLVAKSQ